MDQKIISSNNDYAELDCWIKNNRISRVCLVCDESISYIHTISEKIKQIENGGVFVARFSKFKPNPTYESVVEGVNFFRRYQCDSVVAVGGGSALDVAKCIKLYHNLNIDENDDLYFKVKIIPNNVPFLAIPTTAGTGSEATRYAVIYYNNAKQSITSDSCIPDTVLLDPSTLVTLPLYQRKATMSDALCHAIESFWSINSTSESKEYSKKAIKGIFENYEGYIENDDKSNTGMMIAAHLAGKAINITQTTAGHAMCYKLTNLFNVSHGHAAFLCDRVLFPWMIENTHKCIDTRGENYLKKTLDEIGYAMDCNNAYEGATKLNGVFDKLGFVVPTATEDQFVELKRSVNLDRLKNHPIKLDQKSIDRLYHQILKVSK